MPYIDETILLGGFYCPTVSVVDSLRAGTIMRERGHRRPAALQVFADTDVSGMDVEHGRIRRVHTSRGTIEAETVVIACGVWSPLLARDGRRAHPAHAGRAPDDRRRPGAALRAVDARRSSSRSCATWTCSCTSARTASGSRSARTRTARSSTTRRRSRRIEEAALSPTEFPFTQADFDPQMEDALDLMPEIVGDESVGVKYAINGLISLTPDGMPILGETPEVKGLWSAAAVWVKEGPGVGKSVAEWMVHGESHIDLHTSDVEPLPRPPEDPRARRRRARSRRSRRRTGSSTRPSSGRASAASGVSPMHAQEKALGAAFYEAVGWERPQWYEANAPLVERYGVEPREAEWDARWWSPIINAEHLAMREHAGIFDLSAFAIFDVQGAGALDALQRRGARADGRPGRAGRLHAGARPGRRLQVGPHDHAPRRRGVPRRHRRRPRHGRPQAVLDALPDGRLGERSST